MTTTGRQPAKAAGGGITLGSLIVSVLLVLISIELGAQFAFRVSQHRWLFAHVREEPRIFQRHPYLVGTPIPKVDVTVAGVRIVHNSMGFRGFEFDPKKKPGVTRIVTLGASTTYCTGVTQGETWPELLAKELGDRYEVINLAAPGYGTVENLFQTAFLISDLAPDVAIYYEGWSDIRNMHIKNLAPDYSNYHPRAQYSSLQLGPPPARYTLATLYYLRQILVGAREADPLATFQIEGDGEAFTDKVDNHALSLYMRNLASIIALDRSKGIVPVFIPQLLNYDALTKDAVYGWLPYVKDKDIRVGIDAYNEGMKKVAEEQQADFVGDVLRAPFGRDDFWDNGHFNKNGSAKFAALVSRYILTHDNLRNKADGGAR